MSAPQSNEARRIWVDQCEAAEGIRERFGLEDALNYLIGEKVFTFVAISEQDGHFAAELPAFVAEARRLFTPEEIGHYLDDLERTKFLAPDEPDFDEADPDDEGEEELWTDHPVLAAEELLRFSRIRRLLQD